MKHPVVVNGIIINLASHHGMSAASTLEMIGEAKRIQGANSRYSGMPAGNLTTLEPSRPLTERDAAFHAARHRIRQIERAIANCAAGRPHGIKRKKWRSNGNDSKHIMAVLGHVLSRPNPVNSDEILADAAMFLRRTGEWGGVAGGALPPMPSPDLAPLIIQVTGGEVRLSNTATRDYGIKFPSHRRGRDADEITILLKETLPVSIEEAIQGRIETALGGRGFGNRHLDDPALQDIEARHFIDWNGLAGPMRAWLTGLGPYENSFDKDYCYQMTVHVEYASIAGQN